MTFFSNPKHKDYVLNPRGRALYDDSNRFGTKMLEKMGWSKGKGLGAKLDGQLEFIKVSHKNDQQGMGFKDVDDQWTTHENNFNSLLKSFQSAEDSNEQGEDLLAEQLKSNDRISKKERAAEKVELFSGVSLEEQSKNSRARVHYKKFTRGKDLSRYSEKDLANIFGKKSLEINAEALTDKCNNDSKIEKALEKTPDFGITTVETGTTINDYFKNKMKQITNGLKKSANENVSEDPKEKKSRKKSKNQSSDIGDNNKTLHKNTSEDPSTPTSTFDCNAKKQDGDLKNESSKKKKRKMKLISEICIEETENTFSASKKLKKNKEEKRYNLTEAESLDKINQPERENEKSTKEESSEIICESQTGHQAKKSKKNKEALTTQVESNEKGKESNKEKQISHDVVKIVNDEPAQKKILSKQSEKSQNSTNLFDSAAGITKQSSSNETDLETDNVYRIRRYRTEIFRYVDLGAFPGSTLYDIPGYGYTSEMTLEIIDKPGDAKLINNMWDEAQDKYGMKKKKKRFLEHIDGLKKKSIFKI
ncbi:PIN2/TERF1-interacting telomerase inhibitor 1 [Pseudolycoriella hygida]|uniref:PIN2/TERF1-interacting telomerase inhibitor 1 n=1 Tax=Pseudolycoriella hygida TaxID=35572 RepID=A0A9Q0S437_9DIPT|nr:PIN2/TERF1-interacting telomerase inhibitor 1 [Pseudolycoriella hygida]